MGRALDLTGAKFGQLVAVEFSGKLDSHGARLWRCKCACGRAKDLPGPSLKRGNHTDCGCGCGCVMAAKGMVGKRIGRLVVVKEVAAKSNSRRWLLRCDCGVEKTLTTKAFNSGKTRSCGCSKVPDLKDQRFGQLVAESIERHRGYWHWRCLCDCGDTRLVRGGQLRNGDVVRCRKCTQSRTRRDLKDQRFGRLVAKSTVARAVVRGGKQTQGVFWKCLCDCGATKYVLTGSLTGGAVKSCGGCAAGGLRWSLVGGVAITRHELRELRAKINLPNCIGSRFPEASVEDIRRRREASPDGKLPTERDC